MSAEKHSIIRASDVMRRGIIAIDGLATVKEAAEKMRAEKIACLLVEKRNADDAWGIVVIQDLIRGVIIPGRPSTDVNVFEVMTKPVITVPADMDIRYVARLLHRLRLQRMPVEEKGELIGMVSLTNLILNESLF